MFNFDKRILYVILAIMVVVNVASRINSKDALLVTLVTLPAILIAITFHEFAHAFAADRLGDETPRSQGRLTLNPFAHIDPIGLGLLIVAGFGWGKPVQINPSKFNRKVSMSTGEVIVSIAGPLMNFLLAIVFSVLMALMFKFNWFTNVDAKTYWLIVIFILENILINVGLGVFNLIPLPPLDGSKIISGILPYNARNWFEKNAHIFYIVFLVIWITGIAGLIISPAIRGITGGLLTIVGKIFGIDLATIASWFGI
jgi:Zn-dependent protease